MAQKIWQVYFVASAVVPTSWSAISIIYPKRKTAKYSLKPANIVAANPNQRILFVSHECTRTGAPLILLWLLQWIRQYHGSWQVDLLSLKDGELLSEFEDTVHTHYRLSQLSEQPAASLLQRAGKKLVNWTGGEQQSRQERFINNLAGNHYRVIYANTIASIPVAIEIKKKLPAALLVAHIHELAILTEYILPGYRNCTGFVDHFIAASNPVASFLLQSWKAEAAKLETVFEFSKPPAPASQLRDNKRHFIVGGSGTVHWRKGTDFFLQLALWLKTNHPDLPIRLQWVGEANRYEKAILDHDLKYARLDNISFLGALADPFPVYRDFDVFLLTSREDPFPLVAIEIASMAKPIICFEAVTGTAEFVEKGAGKLVPYADVAAMGRAVVAYFQSPAMLKTDGEKARDIFMEFTPQKSCTAICQRIETLLFQNAEA